MNKDELSDWVDEQTAKALEELDQSGNIRGSIMCVGLIPGFDDDDLSTAIDDAREAADQLSGAERIMRKVIERLENYCPHEDDE